MLVFRLFIVLLVTTYSQSVWAAWPDSSTSRNAALKVMRRDLITPHSVLYGQARHSEYGVACNRKSPYFAICKYDQWTTKNQRGSSKAAADFLANRCPKEPLACVVNSWYYGFINGSPDKHAPDPAKARQQLEAACSKKHYAAGCAHLGEFYELGVGGKRNPKRASELYQEACKAKDAYGCYLHAALTVVAAGKTRPDSLAQLEKICQQDKIAQACFKVAQLAQEQLQEKRAQEYYRYACNEKHGGACYQMAKSKFAKTGDTASQTKAVELFTTLCTAGENRSCNELKKLYQQGKLPSYIKMEGPGALSISSDVQAKIFIDGKLIRSSPLFKYTMKSGKHRVYISHPDGRIKKFEVDMKPATEMIFMWSFAEKRWLKKDEKIYFQGLK